MDNKFIFQRVESQEYNGTQWQRSFYRSVSHRLMTHIIPLKVAFGGILSRMAELIERNLPFGSIAKKVE